MSFAIFIREVAIVLRAPLLSTKASWAACQNFAIQWNQNREMSGRKNEKTIMKK